MTHEDLPAGERQELIRQFYRVIVPETREDVRQLLSARLARGSLRQVGEGLTQLLTDLWSDPDAYFDNIRAAWRARPPRE